MAGRPLGRDHRVVWNFTMSSFFTWRRASRNSLPDAGPGRRPSHHLGGTLIRLWLAAVTGLGYDESYMAGNARDLALRYFDHPPLHVWLAWAAERLFGSEVPLAVRLPFVLLFAGSTWLMFRLTARLFGERAGLWAAIAFNLAPVFSLSDGSWVLPDGPAIFFLLAGGIAASIALFDERTARGHAARLARRRPLRRAGAAVEVQRGVPSARRVRLSRRGTLGPPPSRDSPARGWRRSPRSSSSRRRSCGTWSTAGWASPSGEAHRRRRLRPRLVATEIGGELAYLTPWLPCRSPCRWRARWAAAPPIRAAG